MANGEQLAVLYQGKAAWNAWRGQYQNWNVRPDLSNAKICGMDLSKTALFWADLSEADLFGADLSEANLRDANLTETRLVRTNLRDADLTGCRVYGISAWDLILDGAKQKDLIITPPDEPDITVDNLEVAQFIYLLLNNEMA